MSSKAIFHSRLVILFAFAYPTAALHPSLPDLPTDPPSITTPFEDSGPLTPSDRTAFHRANAPIEQQDFTWISVDLTTIDLHPAAPPPTIRLAVSSDLTFDVRINRSQHHPGGSTTWTGTVEGIDNSLATLTIRHGTLSATIHTGQPVSPAETGIYQIRPVDAERHAAWQLTPQQLKTCGNPPTGDPATAWSAPAPTNRQPAETTARGAGAPGCDDGTVIDIMFAYTSAARTAAGGTIAMQALINQAVADANQSFADSEIDTALNLVHTQEVAYSETGVWEIDGPNLTGTTDGQLDEVHALRNQYGADCVSLIVEMLNTGGIGYFPDTSLTGIGTSGFSILRRNGVSNNILAHEIGHNFWCAHDRPHNSDVPYAGYSYGYVEPGGAWQTIMAVEPTAAYIPYFANPNLVWPGPVPPNPGPMGIAEGNPDPCDVARTINETRHIVANFRATAVPAAGPVLHVRSEAAPGGDGSTWPTAFNDLHRATCAYLGSNGAVSEVWIKEGTYRPDGGSGLRTSTFTLPSGLTIYGGFAGTESTLSQRNAGTNVTVLSGDIGLPDNTSDNCYNVVTASLSDPTAVLDGFTITAGNANHGNLADGFVDIDDGGGGIFVFGGGSPKFLDCTITGNTTIGVGGGALVAFDSSPTFQRCRFIDNAATGPAWPSGGGGACNYAGGSATYQDCTFSGNSALQGGAMSNMFDSLPGIDRCIFRSNTAGDGGGGMYNYGNGSPAMTNCLFTGNTAGFGGAMANLFSSNGETINCTLVGNTATIVVGGAYLFEVASTFRNTILWGNAVGADTSESAQVGSFSNSTPLFAACTVQGWTGALGGPDNNGLSPQFRDANGPDNTYGTADDDPRLLPGSPAINTASNAAIPPGITKDLDGKPRILGPFADRGTYETNPNPFDFDGNGTVAAPDYAVLYDCLAGPDTMPAPTSPTTPQACLDSFDTTADQDVDLHDIAAFTTAFGG